MAWSINTDVSLGQVLTALVMAGGFVYIYATNTQKVAETKAAVDTSIVSISALRSDMNSSFATVRNDIAGLPNVQAELTQHERRLATLEQQQQALADAVYKQSAALAGNAADIANLLRATGTPITPPQNRR